MNTKFPLITAHSGFMGTPANTIISVLEGVKSEAEFIEVDVRATKDGIAVLAHDNVLKLPLGRSARVEDISYEEINALRKNGEKMTKLEEALDLAKSYNKMMNLDLKLLEGSEAMINAIKRVNMVDSVLISGCDYKKACHMSKNYPGFQVLLNAEEYADEDIFAINSCRDAVNASCCGININHRTCSIKLLEYARLRCLPVFIWTVDRDEDMKRYIEMGVDSITTNNVKALCELKSNVIKDS